MRRRPKSECVREARHWIREVMRATGMAGRIRLVVYFEKNKDREQSYGSAVSQPQYQRAEVWFDFENDDFWRIEQGDIRGLVIHELGHVFLSCYSLPAETVSSRLKDNGAARGLLDQAEERWTTEWERMPMWESLRPYRRSS